MGKDKAIVAALERLHLEKCRLSNKAGAIALFIFCHGVKDLIFRDCWGLNDDVFWNTIIFRRVRYMSLEGCSMLTTNGLEVGILSWTELQILKVMPCNKIKDNEITPSLSCLFSTLKDLQRRPDTKSLLSANLVGMSIGKMGTKFFEKACD